MDKMLKRLSLSHENKQHVESLKCEHLKLLLDFKRKY
jgi:hypothetical protein